MAKILLVDDEEHIRVLYQEELKEEGYDVVTAATGHGLLNMIAGERPDVVVLDIRLADENGLELLQEIRNTYYDLPVILCSAYESFKKDVTTIAADAYVVKSSDLNPLKKAIRRAVEGRSVAGSKEGA